MDRVKKLKIQLSAAIFVFFCMIIFGGFFSPDFKNFALALSPNYSKTLPGATLNLTEWNNLDDDFVAKSGSAMTGILNMGGYKITNLATPTLTSPASDAANKAYVDARIAAIVGSGSGGTFVNWGSGICPTGDFDFLYGGIGFGADSDDIGGSNNPICMDSSGSYGGGYSDPNADKMFPLVTGSGMPTDAGSLIVSGRAVKCAVCRKSGTCYESYGNWGCATGFSSAYDGFVLGAVTTYSTMGNSGQRLCVNTNFDSTISLPADGVVLVGSRIENAFGLVYSTGTFVKCSVCCN